MKLKINEITYDVPPDYERKLIDQLLDQGMLMYDEQAAWVRIGAKAITRKKLLEMERQALKEVGEEAAQRFKPPHGADPNLFLAGIYIDLLEEMLAHVELTIEIDDISHTAAAFNVAIPSKGLAWGQVDTPGYERLREDDGIQVP